MSTLRFVHDSLAQRVLFGAGEAAQHLAAEIQRLGARRIMLIAGGHDPQLIARLAALIAFTEKMFHDTQHVPVKIADEARDAAVTQQIDLIVAIGGGSTTGIAKSVALDTGLPIVAVPTTYAGSEATPVWGRTADGVKSTGSDPRVLPRSVIYDAELTLTLPAPLTIASGLNALAHCVDSLWAPRADPMSTTSAEAGMRAIAAALPAIVVDSGDLAAREQMLLGTYHSALAFASAGSGMHHKICHVLGGRYDLPHASTHAVVLPHVLAFNAPAAPEAADIVARTFDKSEPSSPEAAVRGLWSFGSLVGAPRSLKALGLNEFYLDEATRLCLAAIPASNPKHPDSATLRALLADAVAGRRPVLDTERRTQ